MKRKTNRRDWLRATGLATAGVLISPNIHLNGTNPAGWHEEPKIWERNFSFPKDLSKLKARLLANENPYGPSAKAKVAIMESVSTGNRYGHSQAATLKKILAEKEGVTPEHILLGPGSTDILEKTAIVHFMKGGNIVSADPAYMSLVKTALAFSAKWKNVALTSDFAHDLDGMLNAIDQDTKLVYVCNPNNPTGSITDPVKLKSFCAKASEKAVVFVDEAYLEFLEKPEDSTMVGLVKEGKNVMVTRTFSKIHGMAGIRIGYTVALPETIEKITTLVRSNMGLNVTAINGAIASIQDTEFQNNSRKWTKETREYVFNALQELGYDPIPSYTSFMLFPLKMEGEPYLEQMFANGIGVRVFEVNDKPWCRVSMGTMKEMELFVDSFKKVVG